MIICYCILCVVRVAFEAIGLNPVWDVLWLKYVATSVNEVIVSCADFLVFIIFQH